jgi:hypothetical protein
MYCTYSAYCISQNNGLVTCKYLLDLSAQNYESTPINFGTPHMQSVIVVCMVQIIDS